MLNLLVFLPACFALNLAFGPNNLLSVTHGAQRGVWFATAAGLGRIIAFVPMIAASALGLGALLSVSVVAFTVLKMAGAAYLIYLGVRLIMSGKTSDTGVEQFDSLTLGEGIRREGLIALSNPKAILIFTAFFPQFVHVDTYWLGYASVGGLFLALEVFAIFIYAVLGRLARAFAMKRLHWFQRVSGAGMITFGSFLLFVKQPTSA